MKTATSTTPSHVTPSPVRSIGAAPSVPMPYRAARRIVASLAVLTATAIVVLSVVAVAMVPLLAMVFATLCIVSLVLNLGAWRRRNAALLRESDTLAQTDRRAGIRAAVRIAVTLAIAAFVITAATVGWKYAAIGSAIALCALVIFGGPIWLASVGEEEEDAHEERTGEHDSSR
jgi:hypothetical protein